MSRSDGSEIWLWRQVDLPVGSHLRGGAGIAEVRGTGRLGPVELKTGAGRIAVERAADEATIATGSGGVELGSVGAHAVVKNSNDDTWIGHAGGDLRVIAANGKIIVDQADAAVTAQTANGDIRLGEVTRGEILAETACGRVDIGIHDGVAAWLDLDTHFGDVRNHLEAAEPPPAGAETVEVRGRTAFGDITVSRSVATPAGNGVT